MVGLNKVILIGNLGKDPEVRTFEDGTKVANFSLATTESYKNKDGNKVEQTEWHRIALWRGLADVAEKYLRKGKSIYVEGKITTRKYTDKDGVERSITEIIGDNMIMLGSRQDGGEYSPPVEDTQRSSAPEPSVSEPADDLPF
jgi:single-strand DNA-binding protein